MISCIETIRKVVARVVRDENLGMCGLCERIANNVVIQLKKEMDAKYEPLTAVGKLAQIISRTHGENPPCPTCTEKAQEILNLIVPEIKRAERERVHDLINTELNRIRLNLAWLVGSDGVTSDYGFTDEDGDWFPTEDVLGGVMNDYYKTDAVVENND